MAVALGIILQFATWLPVGAVSTQRYQWSIWIKLAICLVPNLSLFFGFTLIIEKEMDTSGMKWESLGKPTSNIEDLTLLHVWMMLLVDFLLYMLILWYMDNVRPGKFGLAKKLYFPFQVIKDKNENINAYFLIIPRNHIGLVEIQLRQKIKKPTMECQAT